jgi:membrane protease YdiL (CAAX protease family)
LPSTAILLTLLLFGGLWEEPGFAGYAFPRMRERLAHRKYPDLQAALLLGVLWGFWHTPLYAYGILPWYDFFVVVAFRIIWSWIYNMTNDSVPAVMLAHYSLNVLAGSTMFLVFTGTDQTTYYILYVICAWVAALVIAWRSRFELGGVEETPLTKTVPGISARS